ncbi:MAG TPA: hypothetical protein VFE85_06890, partial [Woeseiaceae bacterium]|nr:hypothetical protein [Woeseiaceae bacterium]
MRADLPLEFDLPFAGLPPALLFFAGAVFAALCARANLWRTQQFVLLATPLAGALNLLALDAGTSWVWPVLEFELVQLRVDGLSQLFGLLFHLGAFIGGIYAIRVRDTLQHVAALVYAGSALGAVFAGDLVTLFCYWEGIAVSSALLVFAGRSLKASGAAMRYLVLHLASG